MPDWLVMMTSLNPASWSRRNAVPAPASTATPAGSARYSRSSMIVPSRSRKMAGGLTLLHRRIEIALQFHGRPAGDLQTERPRQRAVLRGLRLQFKLVAGRDNLRPRCTILLPREMHVRI